MPVIIPKKMVQKDDLVIIPRKEYEEFLRLKLKFIPEAEPTKDELRAIREGKKAFAHGDYVTLEELKNELASLHRRPSKKSR